MLDCFLNPLVYSTEVVGQNMFGLGNETYASASTAGMARSRANEIDEFFTPALRDSLLGLPLDLAAINIARGRDVGLPTLNALRTDLHAQTGLAILTPYTSWSDFGAHLQNPSSLKNFIMAYAGADLRSYYNGINPPAEADFSATDWANLRSTDWATFKIKLGQAADAAMLDSTFMGGGNARFNDIDLYIGGLAEAHVSGGMLGSTFDFVTAVQMAALRNDDRFAELNRLFGSDMVYEVRTTSFADIIRANVTTIAGLDAFNTHENPPVRRRFRDAGCLCRGRCYIKFVLDNPYTQGHYPKLHLRPAILAWAPATRK